MAVARETSTRTARRTYYIVNLYEDSPPKNPTYYIVNLYDDSPPKNPAYSQTGTNKMNQPEGQDHEGGSNVVSVFGSTLTSLAVIPVAREVPPDAVPRGKE